MEIVEVTPLPENQRCIEIDKILSRLNLEPHEVRIE